MLDALLGGHEQQKFLLFLPKMTKNLKVNLGFSYMTAYETDVPKSWVRWRADFKSVSVKIASLSRYTPKFSGEA